MQLRIFRRVTPSLLRHSLYTRYRYHFNNLAPAPATGGIKPLSPHQPCWHGLDKEMLDACAPPARQPEELRKLIEEAKVPPAKKRERSPRRKPDEMGRWLCNQCGQMLFQNAFSCRIGQNFPPSICRKCENKESLLYRRTLRGNLKHLQANALRRARMKGLEFSLSFPQLGAMLEFQGGHCAYSGLQMEIEQPNSHWRMSLERIDNHLGYTSANCSLVAGEFNSSDFSLARNVDPDDVLGTAQWSRHKVQEVSRLRNQRVDSNRLEMEIEDAQKRPSCTRGPKNCHSYATCRAHSYAVSGSLGSACLQHCDRQIKRPKHTSLRKHLQKCLSNARQSARRREQDCCITFDFLLNLLAWQGGVCYYSGVPLQYTQVHTDWKLSIERLDNSIGYTPDNCVLIAVEFNTPDYSRNRAVTEVFGTAQWSREKVWHVWRGSSFDQL